MVIKNTGLATVACIMIMNGIYGLGHADSTIPAVYNYQLAYNDATHTAHTVTFEHAAHAMEYKIACIQCHHTLEPGATAVDETCSDCHANTEMRSFPQAESIPEDERLDYYFLALHDQCINCHRAAREADTWTKAPVGCWRCHIYTKK